MSHSAGSRARSEAHAGGAGNQIAETFGRQRSQDDLRRAADFIPERRDEARGIRVELAGPIRDDQAGARPSRKQHREAGRRRIDPLRVVDDHRVGHRLGERRRCLEQPRQHVAGGIRGQHLATAVVGQQAVQLAQVPVERRQCVALVVEPLGHRRQGHLRRRLPAVQPARARTHFLQQPRLAHALFAGEQDHAMGIVGERPAFVVTARDLR